MSEHGRELFPHNKMLCVNHKHAKPLLCVPLLHLWLTHVFSAQCRHNLQSEHSNHPGSRLPRSWTTACCDEWQGDQLFFCREEAEWGDGNSVRLGDISQTAIHLMYGSLSGKTSMPHREDQPLWKDMITAKSLTQVHNANQTHTPYWIQISKTVWCSRLFF